MRRPPVFATLVVVAAVATMIALGFWQLRRAEWKERLLAEYTAAATMPPVDLDPLLDGSPARPALSFRRVLVTCHARDIRPDVRAGRNAADAVGQAYLIPCRPGAEGFAGRIRVNVGWSAQPDSQLRPVLDGIVAGRLGEVVDRDDSLWANLRRLFGGAVPPPPVTLIAATATPPLVPSARASIESIPNNHLFYAFEWFFFAAAAAMIYWLALRRRNRGELPPEP